MLINCMIFQILQILVIYDDIRNYVNFTTNDGSGGSVLNQVFQLLEAEKEDHQCSSI